MMRDQLEHAIPAACDIANDAHVIVIGSQAILGQLPDAPVVLTDMPATEPDARTTRGPAADSGL